MQLHKLFCNFMSCWGDKYSVFQNHLTWINKCLHAKKNTDLGDTLSILFANIRSAPPISHVLFFCLSVSLSLSVYLHLSQPFFYVLSLSLSLCLPISLHLSFKHPLPPSLIDWLDQICSRNCRLFCFVCPFFVLCLSVSGFF